MARLTDRVKKKNLATSCDEVESINYEKHDSSDSDDDDDVIIDNNSNDDHLKFDNHIGKDCPFTLIGQSCKS
ncbi:hypothetical protein TYRP_023041 [Tyrophagus putrescentiae]|nr:hypothetical protein TYRP_023041 [Tyrophagus putrescentiae]